MAEKENRFKGLATVASMSLTILAVLFAGYQASESRTQNQINSQLLVQDPVSLGGFIASNITLIKDSGVDKSGKFTYTINNPTYHTLNPGYVLQTFKNSEGGYTVTGLLVTAVPSCSKISFLAKSPNLSQKDGDSIYVWKEEDVVFGISNTGATSTIILPVIESGSNGQQSVVPTEGEIEKLIRENKLLQQSDAGEFDIKFELENAVNFHLKTKSDFSYANGEFGDSNDFLPILAEGVGC